MRKLSPLGLVGVIVWLTTLPAFALEETATPRELEIFAPRFDFDDPGADEPALAVFEVVSEDPVQVENHGRADSTLVARASRSASETQLSRDRLTGRSSAELLPQPPGHGPNGWHTTFGVGLFAMAAADLATTEAALNRGGFRELNPVQRNRTVRIVSHVAVPALTWWVTERLRKQGRGKLALIVRVAATVAFGYAATHNARAMSQ